MLFNIFSANKFLLPKMLLENNSQLLTHYLQHLKSKGQISLAKILCVLQSILDKTKLVRKTLL